MAMAPLPAFPGAEGGGSLAVGGRGGAICRVTTLEDSGPGSLRECINQKGPRTVIFDVGGTIKLKSRIEIRNPYITIAGQTAPGGGIQIKADKNFTWRPDIVILTHDVIIRYIRLRRGYVDSKEDNISVSDGGRNVILDHLSIFWGENQNFATRSSGTSNVPRNITLQNSIIAEMVDGRVSMLIQSEDNIRSTDIDFHNNFIANASHRNPRLRVGQGRFINNIVYNWGSWASRTEGGVHFDFISNLWKPGPATTGSRVSPELMFSTLDSSIGHPSDTTIRSRLPGLYVNGNRGVLSGMSPETDNWPYTREFGPGQNDPALGPTPLEWKRHEPLPAAGIPITVRHVDELEDYLLPIVGASMRLDCEGNWVANRDTADQRVIAEYLSNQGRASRGGEGEEIYGGHPSLATGVPCTDSSGDGIPDEWAVSNGLDPKDPSLGNKVHESGYTFLELYLNGIQIGAAAPARIERISVE